MSGPVVDWLRTSHTGTRWTTSVCSGSLILGTAGLLSGLDATSHSHCMNIYPLSAPGLSVSASSSSVMRESSLLQGFQAITLLLEYAPEPPHITGSLGRASIAAIERAVQVGYPHGAIPRIGDPDQSATTLGPSRKSCTDRGSRPSRSRSHFSATPAWPMPCWMQSPGRS